MLLLTDPNFQELLSIPVLCADVAKSPKQYEKYWVVEIIHFKERSLVGHEFMILGVFDCGTNRPLIRLRAERRPSRRKPDERRKPESPPWWSDHMISPSDDTISRLQKSFKADSYDHLATLNLGSPSLRKLSFFAACQIFEQVEDHAWYYRNILFRRQLESFWFCTTFLKRVEFKTGVSKIAGRDSKRQGTPGYRYILGGRLKVLKEDKVEKDIQKRNISQKDIASPLLEPALPDGQSTREETRFDSSSLSACLDGDATGGDGFIAMADDDPYDNFFQQSLPSPSPSFNLPPLFSARRLWNVVSRHRQLPDKSVPKEHSKRGFFSRRTRLESPLEHTIKPIEGEGDEKQRETVDIHDSANDMLGATKYKSNQQDDPPAIAKSPPSYNCTPSTPLDSKNDRKFWERLMQAGGINSTFSSLHTSTQLANSPQRRIRRNLWHWNSSLFPAGSSIHPIDVAACRDEDRYGIAPESDAEAAAAMLRTNNDVADNSTRPGQPAVGARLSQGQPTQTQASTIGPGEIEVSCCGFVISCRHRSNLHQP